MCLPRSSGEAHLFTGKLLTEKPSEHSKSSEAATESVAASELYISRF